MALNAYLKLTGQKQGEIIGSVTQKGREGQIMVRAANHEVVSPRDPHSGLPIGKRQHKPFTITKDVDRSSPRLYQALTTNETITKWQLQFWTPGRGQSGQEQQYYTVELTNATISDIVFHMLDNRNPDLSKYPEYEEISFTYQKIVWVWTAEGLPVGDDWEAP
jgi:type VI secretion system secreted protein Hcp